MSRILLFLVARSARFWIFLSLVLLVGIYSFAIFNNQSAEFHRERVYWLADDMMISMRYARNLSTGQGLVWNPGGERVEGYSNFLWVLIMAGIQLLPLSAAKTSLAVLLINLLCAVAVLILSARLLLRLFPDGKLALPFALVALLLSVDLGRWTVIGMEVPLFTAVFLYLLLRILDEADKGRPSPLTFFLVGLLGIIRTDGLICIALLVALGFFLRREKRRILAQGLLALVLPGLHLAFRMAYYGELFPNTYYLKMTGWSLFERLIPGLQYLLLFLKDYGLLWLAGAAAAFFSRDRRIAALWGLGLPLMAYALYTGGDDFSGARFLSPWLPVLFVLGFLAPFWIFQKLLARMDTLRLPGSMHFLQFVLFLPVVLMSGFNFASGPGGERYLAQAGIVLNQTLLPDTVIAHFLAGTLPYFAGRPAVDLLGKNDPVVARLPIHPGSFKPGHNKFDYPYSFEKFTPDLVIGSLDPDILADPAELASLSRGEDAYSGLLFQQPLFQRQFAGNLVIVQKIPVFIRRDSPEQSRLMVGACQEISTLALRDFGLQQYCLPEWDK